MKKWTSLIFLLMLMLFPTSCYFTGLDPDDDYDYDDDYIECPDYEDENILYFKIDGFGIDGEPTLEVVTVADSVITEIKLSNLLRGNEIKTTVLDSSKISTASVGVLRDAVLDAFKTLYPISSERTVLDTDRYISRTILSRDILIKNSVGSILYDKNKIKSGDELTINVSIPLKNGIRIEGNSYLTITIIVKA